MSDCVGTSVECLDIYAQEYVKHCNIVFKTSARKCNLGGQGMANAPPTFCLPENIFFFVY